MCETVIFAWAAVSTGWPTHDRGSAGEIYETMGPMLNKEVSGKIQTVVKLQFRMFYFRKERTVCEV
jgi:hypothetical protein